MLSLSLSPIRAPGTIPRYFCVRRLSSATTVSPPPPPQSTTTVQSSSRPIPSNLKIYLELSKFRLTALVTSTAVSGYWMGLSGVSNELTLASTMPVFGAVILGTALCSASANTFNQCYEIITDGLMKRTKHRPLPTNRIARSHALMFGSVAGVLGVSTLAIGASPVTATLGALNILLYAGCYTPLKQKHYLNTWVGAVVGAIPPLMGVTAAGVPLLSIPCMAMGAVLFCWQLPHFMALAHLFRDDYTNGGYKMLSSLPSARVALRHSFYLLGIGFMFPYFELTTPVFGMEATMMSGALTLASYRFYQDPSQPRARQLFLLSLVHLPLFLLLAAFHKKDQPARDANHDLGISSDLRVKLSEIHLPFSMEWSMHRMDPNIVPQAKTVPLGALLQRNNEDFEELPSSIQDMPVMVRKNAQGRDVIYLPQTDYNFFPFPFMAVPTMTATTVNSITANAIMQQQLSEKKKDIIN